MRALLHKCVHAAPATTVRRGVGASAAASLLPAPCMRRAGLPTAAPHSPCAALVQAAAGPGGGEGGAIGTGSESTRGGSRNLDKLLSGSFKWLNSWDATRAYTSGGGSTDTALNTPTSSIDDPARSSSTSTSSIDSGDTSSSTSSSSSSGPPVAARDPAKSARIRQAFLDETLSFGFSAGGLMFPYYVGVVSALEEMGVLRRPHQLAGASAGSLVAAAFNSGLDMWVGVWVLGFRGLWVGCCGGLGLVLGSGGGNKSSWQRCRCMQWCRLSEASSLSHPYRRHRRPTRKVVEESMILFGEDCMQNGTRYRLVMEEAVGEAF